MAPEVVNFEDIALETGHSHTKISPIFKHNSSDQWSVGVLSFILLSGYSPFLDENDDQEMTRTMSNVTM